MESMLFLLGILGFVTVVGGVVGFFSLFAGKKDYSGKINQLEREVESLKVRIHTLEDAAPANTSQQAALASAALASQAAPTATLNVAAQPVEKTPLESPLSPVLADAVSEDDLTQQAMAATPESSNNPVSASAKPIATPATAVPPVKTAYAAKPIKPLEPNLLEKGLAAAKDWLLGGNTMVRSGVVILFLGVAFLLKFASDNNFIPIELRVAGVALLGIALLAFGWKQREKRKEYAWALQGGGIGVLYLTIFATYKLYALIPSGAAFALLIVVAFLSAAIAVLQSALPLAILGFTGGFLAPIFTSTGHGSHVGLFSYYLVLNLAIAFVAFHKSWRPLNVLGFAFTFIIGTLWGAKSYVPEHFATTEPFLIIHFLLFTAIAVMYAHKQSTKATDYVDATLVFGTPIVAFSLQYALLRDSHFGLAYSALALGLFYLGLAWWVLNRRRDTLKFLGECFLALGVGFVTLTLPLALDGRWTSAAWAVEGVGLLWVGLKQHRLLPTLSGLALQVFAALAFSHGWGLTEYSGVAHQNVFLGVGFIALSGWACGALWTAYRPNQLSLLNNALALWGWVWWVGAGLTAIDEWLPSHYFMHAGLLFVALTSVLLTVVAPYVKWPRLARLSVLLLPVMAMTTLGEVFHFSFDRIPPSQWVGWAAWPLVFAAYAWLIRVNAVPNRAWLRAPLLWMIALVGVLEWQHQFGWHVAESYVWTEIAWAILPLVIVGAVTYWQLAKKIALTDAQQDSARTWAWLGSLPLMGFAVAWYLWMSLKSSGYAAPLPYIPLINPLDIALIGTLLLLLIWQRKLTLHLGKLRHLNPKLAGLMGFALLNGVLLRTLHHWVGTPFEWTSLFTNSTVQMAFTFLWGITAFILMLLAHQRAQRSLWIAGAALVGLVVAKIFFLDLAQHGSVERIVSFIGAGIMLLVMGYFAPLPPANAAETKETV